MTPRPCKWCGKLMDPEGMAPSHYAKKVFCGDTCLSAWRHEANRKPHVPHPCAVCGEDVPRADWMKPADYRDKQTCGPQCAHILQSQVLTRKHGVHAEPPAPDKNYDPEKLRRAVHELVALF